MERVFAARSDRTLWPAALLLAFSIALGGGGSPGPLLETSLQILTLAIAGWWLVADRMALIRTPRTIWVIFLLIVGLHAFQLIPLPPALWHALPGRSDERAALGLIGADETWRALTISPARTLASLLAGISAMIAMAMAATLDDKGRVRLLGVVVAAGIATMLVGAAQMVGGSGNPLRFFDAESPFLTGFQGNHNSTADVILIAMLAAAALARILSDRRAYSIAPTHYVLAVAALDGLFGLGVFLTGSRAGIALIAPVLAIQYLILRPGKTRRPLPLLLGSLGAALGLGLAAILVRDNPVIAGVLARFDFAGEFRPELWRDAIYSLGRYWPAGSGMGTIVPVLIAAERLEIVDPTLPNRAHNDYLELAVTGGLPGILVFVCIAALLARAAWHGFRRLKAEARPLTLFSVGVLIVIGLHSFVDYPLRSMALAALTAMASGLLFPARDAVSARSGELQE